MLIGSQVQGRKKKALWQHLSAEARKGRVQGVLNFVNEQNNLNAMRAVHRWHNPGLLFLAQFHLIKRPFRVNK